MLSTPSGIQFGILGGTKGVPCPAVFSFAWSAQESLSNTDYNQTAQILVKHGYVCISLDMPCHGADKRKEDAAGELAGWPGRLEKDNSLVRDFTTRASAVLDYLIQEKYVDPKKVGAFGISRGGFMAYHFAAAESRVACVAGLCPVTDLLALTEFSRTKEPATAQSLALINHALKLAGRPLWLLIGNSDQRVDTDKAVAFARKVTASAVAEHKPADVELHVLGAAGHAQPPHSQDLAAAWLLSKLGN